MKKLFGYIALSSMVFISSCGNNKNKALEKIYALEKVIMNDSTKAIDETKAKDMTEAYLSYTEKFPEDSLCPEFLFKAAQVQISIAAYSKAVENLEIIIVKYPKYQKLAHAMFMKAFVLDYHIKDTFRALKAYQEFIARFPEHEFADDAQISITMLGKSDNEIIKEFESKNNITIDTKK